MNEWNILLEADDEEEKKSKEEEKDEEKKDKEEDKKKDDDTSSSDDDDTSSDDDTDTDDDEYNDLLDSEDFDLDDQDDLDTSTDDDVISPDATDGDYNTLIVAKVDGEASGDDSVYEAAAKVGYAFTVISNNMKHIHLNACGPKFKEIHDKGESYYYWFSENADWAFELASESATVKLDNPTRAKEHCEDVEVEQESTYGFEEANHAFLKNIDIALEKVKTLREAAESIRPDIQSKCDDMSQYLNKESKYFIRKKLNNSSSIAEDDTVTTESYNYNDLF